MASGLTAQALAPPTGQPPSTLAAGAQNVAGTLGTAAGLAQIGQSVLDRQQSAPARVLGGLQGTAGALSAATQTPALQSVVPGLEALGGATTIPATAFGGAPNTPGISGLGAAAGLFGIGTGALQLARGQEQGVVPIAQGALGLGLQAAHAAGLGAAMPASIAAPALAEAAAAGTSLATGATAGTSAGAAASGLGAGALAPGLAAGLFAAPTVAALIGHQLATRGDIAKAETRVDRVRAGHGTLQGLYTGFQGLQAGDDLIGWLGQPLPAAEALEGGAKGLREATTGGLLAALVQGNVSGQYGGWDKEESGPFWAPNPRWAILVPFFEALGIEPADAQASRNMMEATADLSKGATDYLTHTAPAKWAPILDALADVAEQAFPQLREQAPQVDTLALARQVVEAGQYAPPKASVPGAGRTAAGNWMGALLSPSTPDWLWRTLAQDEATVQEALAQAKNPTQRALVEQAVALARSGTPSEWTKQASATVDLRRLRLLQGDHGPARPPGLVPESLQHLDPEVAQRIMALNTAGTP